MNDPLKIIAVLLISKFPILALMAFVFLIGSF